MLVIGGGKKRIESPWLNDDEVTSFWRRAATQANLAVTFVFTAADIAAVDFEDYAIIAIVTDASVSGVDPFSLVAMGLRAEEHEALAARADELANFISHGGGVIGFCSLFGSNFAAIAQVTSTEVAFRYLRSLLDPLQVSFATQQDVAEYTPVDAVSSCPPLEGYAATDPRPVSLFGFGTDPAYRGLLAGARLYHCEVGLLGGITVGSPTTFTLPIDSTGPNEPPLSGNNPFPLHVDTWAVLMFEFTPSAWSANVPANTTFAVAKGTYWPSPVVGSGPAWSCRYDGQASRSALISTAAGYVHHLRGCSVVRVITSTERFSSGYLIKSIGAIVGSGIDGLAAFGGEEDWNLLPYTTPITDAVPGDRVLFVMLYNTADFAGPRSFTVTPLARRIQAPWSGSFRDVQATVAGAAIGLTNANMDVPVGGAGYRQTFASYPGSMDALLMPENPNQAGILMAEPSIIAGFGTVDGGTVVLVGVDGDIAISGGFGTPFTYSISPETFADTILARVRQAVEERGLFLMDEIDVEFLTDAVPILNP